MEFSRRRVLGALAVGGASLAFPRSGLQDAYAQDLPPPAGAIPGFSEMGGVRPLSLSETATGQARLTSVLLPQARAALDRHGYAIGNRQRIGLVDFSAPSKSARFYLIDLPAGEVVSSHLVAHGRGSDPEHDGFLKTFSNVPGSFQTSRGAYISYEWYVGKYGVSIRLGGLDADNSNVLPRAIVMHSAPYAAPEMLAKWGKLGRSDGCFAMSPGDDFNAALLQLSGGRCIFADKLGIY